MASPDFFFVQSGLGDLVLDLEAGQTAEGTRVVVAPRRAQDNDSQLWQVFPRGPIVNKKTGMVVTVLEAADEGGPPAAVLAARGAVDDAGQRWTYTEDGFFESHARDGVLDVQGGTSTPGRVIVWPRKATGTENQTWRLIPARPGEPGGAPRLPVATVSHQGVVFAFAGNAGPADPTMFYQVLELDIDSPSDAQDWSALRPLEFPAELRPAGMDLIAIPRDDATTGTFATGENVPFHVLSDQTYIYVFRPSTKDTLWVSRFSMVQTPVPGGDGRLTRMLEPAWEVRFRHSGKKDVPADDKDTPAFQAPDESYFVEPVTELSMVRTVAPGYFAVALTPAQDPSSGGWHIFAYNPPPGIPVAESARIDLFSFPRSVSGLFDVSGKPIDPLHGTIEPDDTFWVHVTGAEDARLAVDACSSRLAADVYYKQEPAVGADGAGVQLKRSARVMLCFGIDLLTEPSWYGRTAMLDFAVASDGTLAALGTDDVALPPLDPADQVLSFSSGGAHVSLNNPEAPSLAGSFTLEAWVRPDPGAAAVIIESKDSAGGKRGPCLELLPDRALAAFFDADGTGSSAAEECRVTSVPDAVRAGIWQHVAATFDVQTGIMELHVNGNAVELTTPNPLTGKRPPANARPTSLGNGGSGGAFTGCLDEVRVWRVPRTGRQLEQYMHRELPPNARTGDLIGYWPFDEVAADTTTNGLRYTTPDLSGHGTTGMIYGAIPVPSSSPVQTAHTGAVIVDPRGLTNVAGVLDDRIRVRANSAPCLLPGSDGLVHLYFQGPGDEFNAATFDAATSRTILSTPWRTESDVTGDLLWVARRSGPAMNDTARVNISPVDGHEALCDVELHTGLGDDENWRGVPRELDAFVAVLNGEAVADPEDPGLATGRTRFFDYAGQYPASRLPCDGGGEVVVISRRPEFTDPARRPWPGPVPLTKVTVLPDETSALGTVTLTFQPPNGSRSFTQTWTDVSLEAQAFGDTLNGRVADYPRYGQRNPADPFVFALPTSLPASHVLMIITAAHVDSVALAVGPAEPRPDASSPVDLCTVTMTISFAESDIGSDSGTGAVALAEFTWKSVPREQSDFVKHLSTEPDEQGRQLPEYGVLSADGLSAAVLDTVSSLEPVGVGACSSLVAVTVESAAGHLVAGRTAAATTELQGAFSADDTAVLSRGSAVFAVTPAGRPGSGEPALVDSPATAVLVHAGASGGWLAEPARYGIRFPAGGGAVVDTTAVTAEILRVPRDLTMEAWVRTAETPDLVSGNQAAAGTILYAKRDGDDDAYRLGITQLPALRLLGTVSGSDATSLIVEDPDGLLATADAGTVQLSIRPRLASISPGHQVNLWTLRGSSWMFWLMLDGTGSLFASVFTSENKGGQALPLQSDIRLTSETWARITLVRDGSTVRLYVDGRLCAQAFRSPGSSTASTEFRLASFNQQREFACNDVRVYNRPLTEMEVRAGDVIPVDDEGMTLWWPLTEGTGTRVRNIAPTGSRFDTDIGNRVDWVSPGLLSGVYAGVGDRVVRALGPSLIRGWAHVAAAYGAGGALAFDGVSYGDCGSDPRFDFDQEMSVDVFVRPEGDTTGTDQALVGRTATGHPGAVSWLLALDRETRPYFQMWLDDGGSRGNIAVRPAVPSLVAGETRHLAATYETVTIVPDPRDPDPEDPTYEATIRLYLDAVETAVTKISVSANCRIVTSSAPVTFGGLAAEPSDVPAAESARPRLGYVGELSDVRLWSKALPPREIAAIVADRTPADRSGLVAWWPFTETGGTEAADIEGGNTAKISRDDLWRLFGATAGWNLYANGRPLPWIEPLTPDDAGGHGIPQFRIGGIQTGQGSVRAGFDGQVDELRVWRGKRTGEQIADSVYTTLTGAEPRLAGYWRFDAGSGGAVADHSGHGNEAKLAGATWVTSTAPIGAEAPQVRNVLGAPAAPYVVRLEGSPVAVDYADSQRDAYGELIGVMKRCYVTPASEGRPRTYTGFKVGDLERVYLGQVQTRPTVVGYIEGAPPVPSENLSQPYHGFLGSPAYRSYVGSTRLTLSDAEQIRYVYSGGFNQGVNQEFNFKFGVGPGQDVRIGGLISIKALGLEAVAGVKAKQEMSTTGGQAKEFAAGIGRTHDDSMKLTGDWETPDGDGGLLNPETGRRFVPGNLGFAQVKSLTADLYGWRLHGSGALVGTTIVPNPDVEPDVNLITFPINPHYVKQGTLDGWVGLVKDPGTEESYFRPLEAYALKRRAKVTETRLASYWHEFDAEKRGGSAQPGSDQMSEVEDAVGQLPYEPESRLARTTIANTYVWTADGGLYREQEQYSGTRSETYTGEYQIKGLAGLYGSFQLAVPSLRVQAEFDALVGGHLEIHAQQSREVAGSFGLDVEVTGESFLKGPISEGGKVTGYTDHPVPGKVDTYRFMTFYLAPDVANHDAFFGQVVDPAWLERSPSAAAAALRETRAAGTNPVWRVLHRVTYVNRVPPPYQPFPGISEPPKAVPPANLADNHQLIKLIVRYIGESIAVKAAPSPAHIGQAISALLDGPDVSAPRLAEIIPWWAAFRQAAGKADGPERRLLYALRLDLLDYMIDFYATAGAAAKGTTVDLPVLGLQNARPAGRSSPSDSGRPARRRSQDAGRGGKKKR